MSTSNVVHLSAKVAPPSVKDIGSFIARLRHNLRTIAADLDHYADEARAVRAEAQALRDRGSTFDAQRIRRLEQWANKADAHRHALSEKVRRHGYLLADAAPQIDASTTLAERCDLLNVNVADRACLSEDDGVLMILFVHALEDSAKRRHCECNDGPLYQALQRVMMDFLDTPQGQAAGHTLFESGGHVRVAAVVQGERGRLDDPHSAAAAGGVPIGRTVIRRRSPILIDALVGSESPSNARAGHRKAKQAARRSSRNAAQFDDRDGG